MTTPKNIRYHNSDSSSIYNIKQNVNAFINDFADLDFNNIINNSLFNQIDISNNSLYFWDSSGVNIDNYNITSNYLPCAMSAGGYFEQTITDLKRDTNYTIIFFGSTDIENTINVKIYTPNAYQIFNLQDTSEVDSATLNVSESVNGLFQKHVINFKTTSMPAVLSPIKIRISNVSDADVNVNLKSILCYSSLIELGDLPDIKLNPQSNISADKKYIQTNFNSFGIAVSGVETLTSDEFNTLITDEDFVNLNGTQTLNNKTIKSPIINNSIVAGSTSIDLLNTTATTVNAFGAASNINIGSIGGKTTINNNVVVQGDFTVNGVTTTMNSATISVDDKNIELGATASPSNISASGGGITLKGTTDKTFNWNNDAVAAWNSSENINVVSGKGFYINNIKVLSDTTLESGIVNSNLKKVGNLTSGSIGGNIPINTTGNITTTGTCNVGMLSATNFSGTSSGTNTGDQFNILGNAATATNSDKVDGCDVNDVSAPRPDVIWSSSKIMATLSTLTAGAGDSIPLQVYTTTCVSDYPAGHQFVIFNYINNGLNLEVYRNGIRQIYPSDYTEPSSTGVTFTNPLKSGDKILFTVGGGAVGPVGPIGPGGAVGPTGPQGLKGDQGVQGIQGLKGDQGIQGLKGDQGYVGPTGPQGNIGATGVQGPKGDTGADGISPTGTVIYVASSIVPAGYIKANGGLLNRITYSSLFSIIGTIYGAGDGLTTFSLPDLRGTFIRSLDDGRGVDSGRSIGSLQSQLDNMLDTVRLTRNSGLYIDPLVVPKDGSISYNAVLSGNGSGSFMGLQFENTANEVRPINHALLACIKY